MNPLDLPGPQFLIFYAVFGTAVILIVRMLIQRRETAVGMPKLNLTDPYEIAMLRGGESETLRVAAISLVDRRLLKVQGDALIETSKASKDHARRPIEKAILANFARSAPAHEMFSKPSLLVECEAYKTSLKGKKLLAKESDIMGRFPYYLVGLCLGAIVAGMKVSVALSRGRHNVEFLVIMAILFVVVLSKVWLKRRTGLGDRAVADLKTLFQGLKLRAHLLRAGGYTNDATLLAAVFGISALSSDGFSFAKILFPKAASSSNCSSSSCGSTGGCGGDGGGGCGGCGGD